MCIRLSSTSEAGEVVARGPPLAVMMQCLRRYMFTPEAITSIAPLTSVFERIKSNVDRTGLWYVTFPVLFWVCVFIAHPSLGSHLLRNIILVLQLSRLTPVSSLLTPRMMFAPLFAAGCPSW